jgi:hypothetical protein
MVSGKSTLKATSMSTLIHFAGPHLASSATPATAPKLLSFPRRCEPHESLPLPNRGIVLGAVLSTFLWAALFLAARQLWVFLR